MQALMLVGLLAAAGDTLPVGKSTVTMDFGSDSLQVFTYKPSSFDDESPLIMVFHGVLRNAEEYRDDAVDLGDRLHGLIVAPRFDEATFPRPRYQFGGILVNGNAAPRTAWTGEFVNKIANKIRERERRPKMPLYLIGHSGGGQFLVRLAAFVKTDAVRIVAANPGTYLLPDLEKPFPFGFGKLPDELRQEEQLQAYLAQPLTLYLGTEDLVRDEHLDVTPLAEAQGPNRYERGRRAFQLAKTLANEHQWPFHWKLVIADGIEHDHTRMFNDPHCAQALEIPENR